MKNTNERTRLHRRPIRRLLAATAIFAGITASASGAVDAGEVSPMSDFEFEVEVYGVGASELIDSITVELFTDPGGLDILPNETTTCDTDDIEAQPGSAYQYTECSVLSGNYILGLDGVPEGYLVDLSCRGSEPREALEDREATISLEGFAECSIEIYPAIEPNFSTVVFTDSIDHQALLADIVVEAFADPGGVDAIPAASCASEVVSANGSFWLPISPVGGWTYVECTLPAGDYALGLTGLADDVVVDEAECYSPFNDFERLDESFARSTFTVEERDWTSCTVWLLADTTLVVDVAIEGGPAATEDFGIEVYNDEGGALVETLTETNDECGAFPEEEDDFFESVDFSQCGLLRLPAGDYQLGATVPAYGYVIDDVECFAVDPDFFFDGPGNEASERFEGTLGAFTHGDVLGESDEPSFTVCEISAVYVEQPVHADVIIEGGDLDPDDVMIEVYDSDGNLVDSKADPEPGADNASATFMLPIGDYNFGIAGNGDYDVAVTVEVLVQIALIDDASTAFALAPGTFVTAELVLTAPPVVTTTTTTTTSTVAPTTTAAPVVTIDPNAVLPATGSNSTTWPMMLLALGLMAFGGATVFATRRH